MTVSAPRGLRRFLLLLLVVYVAKQLVTAFLFPPFTGPDEVAHFEYIRVLATERRVPTLWADTLPGDLYRYRAYAIEWPTRYSSPLYTSVDPPLYHALMVPVYRAFASASAETIQYVLRCASIPFGIATVVFAFLLTRIVFPRDAFMLVTVPALVAFQPQVSYEAAMAGNDALAIALVSALLYLLGLCLHEGVTTKRAAAAGVLAGLAMLTRETTVISLPLVPAALWMARGTDGAGLALRRVLIACGVLLAVVGPWWVFMVRTYGDPMALGALARMYPDLARYDTTFLALLLSGGFLAERWMETWGGFGWRLIHISGALASALGVVVVVGLAGLASHVAPRPLEDQLIGPQRRALLLLGISCILAYLGIVGLGTRFVLTHARDGFPIVNAAALLLMFGLRAVIPPPWRVLTQVLIVFGMIVVNVAIYTAYVVPYWYFRA